MVDPKLYFCEHLHYSTSAAIAQTCYYLNKADLFCKYSGKNCVILMSPGEIEKRAESHFEQTLAEVGKDIPPTFPNIDPSSPGYDPHKKGGDNPDPRKRY